MSESFQFMCLIHCCWNEFYLDCDRELVFFQCHDGRREALARYVLAEVQQALRSTARTPRIKLGLAVQEVDGPALKVKAGSSISFSQLPKKAEIHVGDLDDLLGLGWDISPHPKIPHHSRCLLRMTIRMSSEGVLNCGLLIGDGKFPSPLPGGQSYRERIVEDLRVSAAAWAI